MSAVLELVFFTVLTGLALAVIAFLVVAVAALRWWAQDMAHLRRRARRVSNGELAR